MPPNSNGQQGPSLEQQIFQRRVEKFMEELRKIQKEARLIVVPMIAPNIAEGIKPVIGFVDQKEWEAKNGPAFPEDGPAVDTPQVGAASPIEKKH